MDQRISDNRAIARRRWVFRMGFMLALAAAFLCFFVAWRRDEMTVKDQLDALADTVALLQNRVDEVGRLPAKAPRPARRALEHYALDADRYYARHATKAVIIAKSHPIPLLLGEDGQAVIVYEAGKVKAKWITVTEFQKAWRQQLEDIRAFEAQRREKPLVLP